MGSQAFPQFGVLRFTDEANRGERCLLLMIRPSANILDQCVHQFRPLVARQLDSSNGDDELGSRLTGTGIVGSQSIERQLLDLGLDLWGDLLNPSCLHLAQPRNVSEGEGVLECNTRSRSDVGRGSLICKFLSEGSEVGGLDRTSAQISMRRGYLLQSKSPVAKGNREEGSHIRSLPPPRGAAAAQHSDALSHLQIRKLLA